MATHSNILAWEILKTEQSGRLEPNGSQRVGHNGVTKHIHTYILLYLCFMFHNEESFLKGKKISKRNVDKN